MDGCCVEFAREKQRIGNDVRSSGTFRSVTAVELWQFGCGHVRHHAGRLRSAPCGPAPCVDGCVLCQRDDMHDGAADVGRPGDLGSRTSVVSGPTCCSPGYLLVGCWRTRSHQAKPSVSVKRNERKDRWPSAHAEVSRPSESAARDALDGPLLRRWVPATINKSISDG